MSTCKSISFISSKNDSLLYTPKSPMFTPVRTISFVLDFVIVFARLTVWLIEALLLFL